jgi:hypothetical protein
MKVPPVLTCLVLAAALAPNVYVAMASPAVDRLEVGRVLPRADLVRAGVHRYARYTIKGDARTLIDIWTRTVSFTDEPGRREMHVHQRWDAADKSYVATFDQTFEAGTFRPLTQSQSVVRDGKTRMLSVAFDGARVDSTSDGQPDARAPLHQTFAMPFFNWNTDMEFLQALPLRRGYAVSIPFYDVGDAPAARYTYAVTGEATLPAGDGSPIPCWVLSFQEKPGEPVLHFWIAKRGQTLLREQADLPQGTLVKTLLNAEAAD